LKTNPHGNMRLDEDPREILGVRPDANDETIRDAYLRKVKENPPDRSPAAFERIRDAYEALRNPHRRARLMFFSGDPHGPLFDLVPATSSQRQFTGPSPWLAALREK
jgi:DnaJ domain